VEEVVETRGGVGRVEILVASCLDVLHALAIRMWSILLRGGMRWQGGDSERLREEAIVTDGRQVRHQDRFLNGQGEGPGEDTAQTVPVQINGRESRVCGGRMHQARFLEDAKITGKVTGGIAVREGSGGIREWCQEEEWTTTLSLRVKPTQIQRGEDWDTWS